MTPGITMKRNILLILAGVYCLVLISLKVRADMQSTEHLNAIANELPKLRQALWYAPTVAHVISEEETKSAILARIYQGDLLHDLANQSTKTK